MSVKANYFKMDEEQFNNYLTDLKNSSNCIHILNDRFFYCQDLDSMNRILLLNKKMNELDLLINSLTAFSKKQIIQSFLIDEIESTNKIENIFSTKHDIYAIINSKSNSKDKKIVSITNAYKQLIESGGIKINSLEDIRSLYDIVLNNAIDKNDLPDGKYFRKNDVYISDGIKNIHSGTFGEDNIINNMKEFIEIYNSKNETFIRLILSHFLFELTHPFYDGNGRLGRFLFSNGLYKETNSFLAFIVSSAIEQEKDKYYKAFKEAEDKYSFGSLNEYVDVLLSIILDYTNILISRLKDDLEVIENNNKNMDLTKSEEKIYKLILEASIYSTFGVSNEEIMKYTQVSKRTLIYTLNKFKDKGLIKDNTIGKFDYHKFII